MNFIFSLTYIMLRLSIIDNTIILLYFMKLGVTMKSVELSSVDKIVVDKC